MNTYALIILIAIAVNYIISNLAEILDNAQSAVLPDSVKDIYQKEEYEKSLAYGKAKSHLSFLSSSVSLFALLFFWYWGGFAYLDTLTRGWSQSETQIGIYFIVILISLQWLLALPLNLYSTFVIEERFGFNRTTPGTYILDTLKGLLLAVILGLPLLATLLWFFQSMGDHAWLWVWALMTGFSLTIQFIAPTWIMPLFNKFQPMPDGELKTKILELAKSIQFPLDQVLVMDGSKRSSKGNAFFSGLGKNKRIALFDTLIEQLSSKEVVAVLAHEIGHYKHKHVYQGILISIIHTGALLYLLSIFLHHPGLFNAFQVEQLSAHAGLIFFSLLFAPIDLVLSILMNAFSRRNEYQADNFAARFSSADDLISGLKTMAREHLSSLNPHPLKVILEHSHPPLAERIRALKNVNLAKI